MRDEPAYQAVLPAPLPGIPSIGLRIEAGCITTLDYLQQEASPYCPPQYEALCRPLQRYFARELPLPAGFSCNPAGTPFQQRVWQRLEQLPPGQVMTYGELARELATSARAVAGACRANPIPILIPCHRVLAASGPGGYLGKTEGQALAIKQWLLQHEGYV